MRKTNIFFSCFEGTRREKNPKYFAPLSLPQENPKSMQHKFICHENCELQEINKR